MALKSLVSPLMGKTVLPSAVVVIMIASALLLFSLFSDHYKQLTAIRDTMVEAVASLLPAGNGHDRLERFLRRVLFAPAFYVLMTGILLLEVFIPAKRAQRPFSPALLHDFMWHVLQLWIFFALQGSFIQLLYVVYDNCLSFLTIQAVKEWPALWLTPLAILLSDFLAWSHHLLRHKVRWLWIFHTVHHSQSHLNAWTDSRYHLVDYLAAELVRFLPLFMLQLNPFAIWWYGFVGVWHARLYHANIHSNFGVFRYVLVTPQSHRVHHSVHPTHQDTNFGALFSVWDQLFRTQYRDSEVYPDTGVNEKDFPLETHWRSVLSLKPLLAQQFYPFTRIWSSAKQP